MKTLLTRDAFRESVFQRDSYRCVICGNPGQDAHHIMERRLFSDGGYYLDNGATVCADHHILAEQTLLSCEDVRQAAGIKNTIIPPHLYKDQRYDKWGNPILDNGQRLRGELFEDESVQKILHPVLADFTDMIKYPRTPHLPWSPGMTKDDRIIEDLSDLQESEVVITEKMDGENTTLYRHGLHARSCTYNPHPSRGWIRAFHARIANDIPEGWRICGENVFAKHSIEYSDLESYFLGFSIWNENNICLSWDETIEWFNMIGINPVKELYRGPWCVDVDMDWDRHEGYVIRTVNSFHYKQFKTLVAKYVRKNHIQTHGHWMRDIVKPNQLRKT